MKNKEKNELNIVSSSELKGSNISLIVASELLRKKQNVIVVVNDKGGVGKSITAQQVLPTILNGLFNTINVYEIDNSNTVDYDSQEKVVNFVSEYIYYKSFTIDEQNNAVFDVSFNEDETDVLSIVDVGGGDDVLAVLASLAKNQIENIKFVIPTNHDSDQFANVKNTISKIKKFYQSPDITLVLNEVRNTDAPKDQFVNFFGKESWGYKPNYPKIEKDISSMCMIPESSIFVVLKNQYRIPFIDMYIMAKDLIDNANDYRQQWRIESKEKDDKQFYFNKLDTLNFATDVVDYGDFLKKSFKAF